MLRATTGLVYARRCVNHAPSPSRLGATPRYFSSHSIPQGGVGDGGKEMKGGLHLTTGKTVKREESLRTIIRSVMEDGKKGGKSMPKGDKKEEEVNKQHLCILDRHATNFHL